MIKILSEPQIPSIEDNIPTKKFIYIISSTFFLLISFIALFNCVQNKRTLIQVLKRHMNSRFVDLDIAAAVAQSVRAFTPQAEGMMFESQP